MKNLLVIIGLLVTSLCPAQDTLFRIISVKGFVALDGDTVMCGKPVTSVNHALKIAGKADYAVILTEGGFAFQLGRGKYAVKEISRAQYSNIPDGKEIGPVYREDISPLRIATLNSESHFLFGDSLTVVARPFKKEINQYRLVVVNVYNKKLYDSVSSSHIHTMKISDLYRQEHMTIFHIEGENPQITSMEYIAKELQPKDRTRITFDFNCIQKDNFIEQELSILALCEINKLYLDQVHHLYKLWRHSQNTGVKITHAYYHRLFNIYQLEKFLPNPLTGY